MCYLKNKIYIICLCKDHKKNNDYIKFMYPQSVVPNLYSYISYTENNKTYYFIKYDTEDIIAICYYDISKNIIIKYDNLELNSNCEYYISYINKYIKKNNITIHNDMSFLVSE